jgi:hypothetical protein
MTKNRITYLLKKAADTFSDGSDPFSLYWLEENKVTLDEAIVMQEFISQAIKGALIKIEAK